MTGNSWEKLIIQENHNHKIIPVKRD